MKKIGTITTIMFTVALISSSAFALWGGEMGQMHEEMSYTGNRGDQTAFYDTTTDLRVSLAADQAELDAILAQPNPDSDRVKTLTQSIDKERVQLRTQAEKHHVYGMGMNHDGGHWNHSGRGYHHNGHMMNWN